MKSRLFCLFLIGLTLGSCGLEKPINETPLFYPDSRPGTRWWWFKDEIKEADIRYQLFWLREHGFGSVEIAWVYPLYRYNSLYQRWSWPQHDTVPAGASQAWLSPEWTEIVHFTKTLADSLGLGCDFTYGSSWPVGATYLEGRDATKIYGDTTFRQQLKFSWDYPEYGLVLDHLDSNAFNKFAGPMTAALQPAMAGQRSGIFTDSWEIKLNATNKVWTNGLEEAFSQRFGYDIIPFLEDNLDSFPEVRYDYMMLLSDRVIDHFFRPFQREVQHLGGFSRVQCLASPTDVMTAYSLVDVPETEALLNNPNYSRIVSSAAALAGKPEVSCEAFTCLYGFPKTNIREEQTADLKLLADALFAKGVNQIFYHGMPYRQQGNDSASFFATVQVGPGSAFESEQEGFNAYMTKVSQLLKRGHTYTDVAVYIPFEDKVMAGPYPPERQRVWVWGQYEMRYIFPPEELAGYHPLWINRHFLEKGTVDKRQLRVGNSRFSALYINVEYLDDRTLGVLLSHARGGLPICLRGSPKQPGYQKKEDYPVRLAALKALPNVSENFTEVHNRPPLLKGDSLPDYWARQVGEELYLFFAHPFTKDVVYPMTSGDAFCEHPVLRRISLSYQGKTQELDLEFKPYQSLMLKVGGSGIVQFEDITYIPKDPMVKEPSIERMHF